MLLFLNAYRSSSESDTFDEHVQQLLDSYQLDYNEVIDRTGQAAPATNDIKAFKAIISSYKNQIPLPTFVHQTPAHLDRQGIAGILTTLGSLFHRVRANDRQAAAFGSFLAQSGPVSIDIL